MDTNFWVIQAFNGMSYGALLFLLASGLSLIFGVMRIVNLAHGSFFLLGGYLALTVIWTTGSWLLALPVAALTVAVIGMLMERVFLRPLGFDPLRQVLLTVGFAYLFQQAALDIWGGDNLDITPPAVLKQSAGRRRASFPGVPDLHDRHGARDRPRPVARDGKDAHGRDGARDGGRRRDGPRGGHRHLPRLHVHLRAGRVPRGARRRDRRRLPRRLSGPGFRDPADRLRRGDHRRHGQPDGRGGRAA